MNKLIRSKLPAAPKVDQSGKNGFNSSNNPIEEVTC